MEKSAKIYVAGHNGMVGSAIVRRLEADGYTNIVTRTRQELDLTRQADVEAFFENERPECVFLAAARVGGIMANMNNQAQFLADNTLIQCNVIDSAYRYETSKLLFVGSSCIYPKNANQPILESALLTGPLEHTNEGYALSKIVGLKMCEYYNRQQGANFISLMPCNLYGYNDNFNPEHSHFLPGLMRRFHEAKLVGTSVVTVWGSGKVYRELMFVDDLASACLFAINNYSGADFLNVGYGEDFTIAEFAQMIKGIVGYEGDIVYDTTKPDGMPRKKVDSAKIRDLGWSPSVSLKDGISMTYRWYVENIKKLRGGGRLR